MIKSVLLIGDSILKNINPKKLSKRKVHKRTFPGKDAEEIKKEVHSINIVPDPAHVIIHAGTNNLLSETAECCVSKINDLVECVKSKFQNSKVAISGITHREDVDVSLKLLEVNKRLKQIADSKGYVFIDNSIIDNSSLNESKLHLNVKGSALLAARFIKFLRADRKPLPDVQYTTKSEDFQRSTMYQLANILMQMATQQLRLLHQQRKKPR